MRLLKLDDTGEPSLVEPVGDNNLEYAILSHTWGANSEEVTYEDLMNGTGKNKSGYEKIRFCLAQAARDGLRYSWVDTCCINKADFTELSGAINSMFRWYSEATRCYVYLSDVPDPNDLASTAELAFPKSRWFTRGWTLQELIAPKSVQFFSRNGEPLGTKKFRELQLHQITGIAIEALQGNPLSQFAVAERMLWAARRITTVDEDAAYCLLGIFNLHMPLIYGEGRKEALDRLQRKIQKSLGPELLVSADALWIVPFERNPCFTGRESQLIQLEEKLFAKDHTSRVAITGLGGVGKTQLVLELLFQTKERHKDCFIIWIAATSSESIYQGYLEVARQLGISGWEDEKMDVRKLVQEYLGKDGAGRWLLVFDNADDINMWVTPPKSRYEPEQASSQGSRRLIDYLPRNKQGCIIFTTRDRKTAVKLAKQNIIEVSGLDKKAAIELLKKSLASPGLVENQLDATLLLAELTYLPLAIVQAAAYINENGIMLADYLSLLREEEEEIIDLLSEEFEDSGRYHDVKNPIATTWLISFEQIRRRDPLAADYLSFMACVNAKDIPQSLLPPGPSRKKEIDAIGMLNAYSFVSRRPTDLALDLHRLVHLATRNWLRKEGLLIEWTRRAILQLEKIFPNHDHRNRSVWRIYLPHVHYVLESDLANKDGGERLALMWRYGTCLFKDGRWNEAEVLFTQVLEIDKRKLGGEHPNTLNSIVNLASTYRNQGRWKEAEELEVQVKDTTLRLLGAEHPHTLRSISNLASTFWNQGRWKEAEELQVQVKDKRLRVLGAEHPDTLASISNLASTYNNQGRWKEAEELQVQVKDTRLRVLGAEHPDTLRSISNLASTYGNQGRWKEAEELEAQVMDTRLRVLGAEHPDMLTSIDNLASTYGNQGRWKEAEELQVQELETGSRILGAEHPDTLISMENLALIWRGSGRDMEALQLLQKCVRFRKQILGSDHPYTISSLAILDEWQPEKLYV